MSPETNSEQPLSWAGAARVVAVASSPTHTLRKALQRGVELAVGEGVIGDAHRGVTVKHRSRVAKDPNQPNLRQVHLIHAELFDELQGDGFELLPGEMGENLTTRGVDLLALPRHARLHVGDSVVLEVTGLRNPCGQLNGVRPGLLAATRVEQDDGSVLRKAGVMCIVVAGGWVAPGDSIRVMPPDAPPEPLDVV